MVRARFQVTANNSAHATWLIYHSPIVTLLAVEPYKGPLDVIPDVYDELEPDYDLLQDDAYDEHYLYVSSQAVQEDHLLPEELFDQPESSY